MVDGKHEKAWEGQSEPCEEVARGSGQLYRLAWSFWSGPGLKVDLADFFI